MSVLKRSAARRMSTVTVTSWLALIARATICPRSAFPPAHTGRLVPISALVSPAHTPPATAPVTVGKREHLPRRHRRCPSADRCRDHHGRPTWLFPVVPPRAAAARRGGQSRSCRTDAGPGCCGRDDLLIPSGRTDVVAPPVADRSAAG